MDWPIDWLTSFKWLALLTGWPLSYRRLYIWLSAGLFSRLSQLIVNSMSDFELCLNFEIISFNTLFIKDWILWIIFRAPAPVHISSFLSRHYRIESTKSKEHSAELTMASEFCESVAKDLISISCAEDSEAVLNSIDGKNVAFLDFLIDCELKQCVSHSLVQQYVSQIWFGELKMEDWKLMLIFLVAFCFPPLWVYLSLPFKNRHRQIPVIKFICRLISHLYLILILCLTVVVPWKYSGNYLAPHWFDYFLYLWIIGMLIAEFSSERVRSGLGWFPTIVVLLVLFSELLRVIAVGYDTDQRLEIVFARNQFLGAAVMLSVLQLLDFLSIHRLFGPWGVIIGHLVVDVLRFLLILLIFFFSFTLQLLAVLKVSWSSFQMNERVLDMWSADSAELAIINLISNKRKWNYCLFNFKKFESFEANYYWMLFWFSETTGAISFHMRLYGMRTES